MRPRSWNLSRRTTSKNDSATLAAVMFGVIVGALSIEWIWRRRRGLSWTGPIHEPAACILAWQFMRSRG